MALVPTPKPTQYDTIIAGLKQKAIPNAIVDINAVAPNAIPTAQALLNPPSGYDLARLIFTKVPQSIAPAQYPVPDLPTSTATPMTKVGTSKFGTPVYANIEFQASEWVDFNGRRRSFSEMSFDTVLMNVQQQKNIIETEIQGSDYGAVLEYSGLRNYEIMCDIIITGENGIYPQDTVTNIIEMLNAPIPIKVNSWFLQNLDIFDVTVRDYSIPQVAGGISQQPIHITFSSNNSSILIIQ